MLFGPPAPGLVLAGEAADRVCKTGEERGYLQPVLGVGASVSVSGLKLAWRVIQQLFTGVQYSKPDYVNVTSSIPERGGTSTSVQVRVMHAQISSPTASTFPVR